MKLRSFIGPLILAMVFCSMKAAASNDKWLEAAQKYFTEDQIELSLPPSGRGLRVPISISRNENVYASNVGDGWKLDVPAISLDVGLMQRMGSDEPIYALSGLGQLQKRGDYYVPLNQENSAQIHIYELFDNGQRYFAVFDSSKPRQTTIYGQTPASRLNGEQGTVIWNLSSIQASTGESTDFTYETAEGAYPRLIGIRHSDRALAVRLEWAEKNEVPVPSYTYGTRVISNRHLSRVVVFNRNTKRDLYATTFAYAKDSWTSMGRSYLQRVSRLDLLDGMKSPDVSAEYCYAGTCGATRPGVGKGTIDIPTKEISEDLSKGMAKFSRIYRNGQIAIAYGQGTGFSTRLMESARVVPDTTQVAFIKKGNSVLAGNPADFSKDTIWGMADFNGDGVDDLWYVPKPLLALSESRINIRMMKADGTFLKGESAAGVPFFGASRSAKSYKFARIQADKSLSFIAGPNNLALDSFVISKWDLEQKKFVNKSVKYADAFDDSIPTEPTYSSKQRFADLNADGLDDWIEIKKTEAGDNTVLYFHGKGAARFAKPVSCILPQAFDFTFTAIDFVDVDGDGLVDVLAPDKGFYLLNSGAGCFSGPNGKTDTYFTLTFDGSVGSDTGVNRLYLDANGDGRQDLLVYGALGASYHSFLGTRPDPRKVIRMTNSFGLRKEFGYEPVVGFAAINPIGVTSPRQQGIFPSITEGFMVVSRILEKDMNRAQEPTRTTQIKYWGPTYHEANQLWAGFQIVETLRQGDATQATQIKQTMNTAGRVKSPYLIVPTLETQYTASGVRLESTTYKYTLLGEYQIDDPFNTQDRTYRTALKSQETVLFGDSEVASLRTKVSVEYEFDKDIDSYKAALHADEAPSRTVRTCDGRTCSQVQYDEPFTWQVKELGFSFTDNNLVKSEDVYAQASPDRHIGRTEYVYHPDLGLPSQIRKCGDNLCSTTNSDTTTHFYYDNGYPKSIASARGAETVYHRNETFPWLLTGTETRLPAALHEPMKRFFDEIVSYNEAEFPETQIDIQGRKVKGTISPQGFELQTETFALGSDSPFHKAVSSYDSVNRRLQQEDSSLVKDDDSPRRLSGSEINAFGNVIKTFAGEGEKRTEQDFAFGPLGLNHSTNLPHFPGEVVTAQTRVFDERGNKITVVRSSGLTISAVYNGRFITLTEKDPNTDKTSIRSFEVNNFNEVTGLTNELGAEYFFERDEAGEIAVYRDGKGIERVFERDLQRRITGIKERVNNGAWQQLRTVRYGVDTNPDEIRSPSGAWTSYKYDPMGRTLVRESFESGGLGRKAATFRYDRPLTSNANFLTGRYERSHHGQLTQVAMDPGLTKSLIYNDRGLNSETEHVIAFGDQTFLMRMQYSGFGELNRLFYPDGYQVRRSFDNQGRLRGVDGRPDASSKWTAHVAYDDYRAFGSAETINFGNGVRTKATFVPGYARIQSLTSTNKAGQTILDLNYVLDAFDNIETLEDHALKLPGVTSSFSFDYDAAQQLKSASGPYGTLAYDYDSSGLMLNFEGTTFEFDPLNPLRPEKQKDASGKLMTQFGYDADGNRIMKEDIVKGVKTFYDWDAEGRLDAVCQIKSCAEGGHLLARYYYDESGSRIAKMGGDGQLDTVYFGTYFEVREREKQWVKYIHDSKDQIVASLHTEKGSSLTLTRWWKDIVDVTVSAFSGQANGSVLENSRVDLKSSVHLPALGLAIGLFGTIVWLSLMILQKILSMALTSRPRRRLWHRISASVASFAVVTSPLHLTARAYAAPADESVLYYHSDHVGSSSLITNTNGDVVQRNVLKPFGGLWKHPGLENTLTSSRVAHYFQGLERDVETGLDVMGARMYDSSIGQFVSRDPMFESDAELGIESPNELSLYAFAKNNPLRYTDPTGLVSEDKEEEWATDESTFEADKTSYDDSNRHDVASELERNWGEKGHWTTKFDLGVRGMWERTPQNQAIGGSDFVSDLIFDSIVTFGAAAVIYAGKGIASGIASVWRSGVLSKSFAPGGGQIGSVNLDLLTLGLSKQPGSAVVNALEGFESQVYKFGRETILLDKSGMKHILERHHPSFWNGSVKANQTFFDVKMSISDVRSAIRAVMIQNGETLASRGSAAMLRMEGNYAGRTFQLGLNRGRIGQFYPK